MFYNIIDNKIINLFSLKMFFIVYSYKFLKGDFTMSSFNDLENAIASFSDKFTNKELNLYLKYFKNIDFNFLNKIENIENFIENFIINDTIIKNSKDFKDSDIPASAILCKHSNLFLIDATL